MFKINKININVYTTNGEYGFETDFSKKNNFIISYENTQGKSSLLEAIYYALGIEEILGGKGVKALRNVYRTEIIDDKTTYRVKNSEFILEIENDKKEICTISRNVTESNLIKVYKTTLNNISENKYEPYYIHLSGAAVNANGFHNFLEKFIGLSLPIVPTYDESNRKLYIQLIFSALFIEQKRGWSDILAGTPKYFKIKEVKKRIIEYLIGLDTLEVEKQKYNLKEDIKLNNKAYSTKFEELQKVLDSSFISIKNLNFDINEFNYSKDLKLELTKRIDDSSEIDLNVYIDKLNNKIEFYNSKKFVVKDNIENLKGEIISKSNYLEELKVKLSEENKERVELTYSKASLNRCLEKVVEDLNKNTEAQKLNKLDKIQDWSIVHNECPICGNSISDNLLNDNNFKVMSLENNIKHIKEQKKLIEYSILEKENLIKSKTSYIDELERKIIHVEEIIRDLVNDLYMPDESYSENVIKEKIRMEDEIKSLNERVKEIKDFLQELSLYSEKYVKSVKELKEMPKDNYTEEDIKKVGRFSAKFKELLKQYSYKSIDSEEIEKIEISKESLIPILDGFDLKFNSSASDSIRCIWSFTISLYISAIKKNNPGIMIFDEPEQQNIINNDLKTFLNSISNLKEGQTIVAMTVKNDEVMEELESFEDTKIILLENYLIKKK
ncbi:hypothetical protein QTI92_00760 [Clostridium perfringens]|jgi:DNA repair exonuclease SbcCD ATPase subunit|uniref:hypothetical protein n=1 Tax=Clostridium perfringens TaxID=1502 RepID=UPI001CC8F562|nr:hypothetical protein [Clostridium perfringens]EJT5918998.1 hypothetical protein [Clostridium perfringens]MDK0533938.1 hypothetical protein [Clostridium perfringens]MDK0903550.1 hypothetical protein [Clostridium perfringens]MDK0909394.1 hypothetical protein [Clostridium perfringens]MDK0918867.1 hypothetical protein [Clostridium perfringens]